MVRCQHCNKKYAKNGKHYLYHIATCKAKNSIDDEVIPSNKEMWHIIKKLMKENIEQKKRIEELEKRVQKDIRKLNMVEWLNTNIKPEISLENWLKSLKVTIDDLSFIFQSNFMRGLENIITNKLETSDHCFKAFSHKIKQLYLFEKNKWRKVTNNDIKQIFGKIQLEILKINKEYEKTLSDDYMFGSNNLVYLKNSEKIMIVDTKKKRQCEKFLEKVVIDTIKINMSDMEKFKFTL